ncbi:uncharacterized protein LOC135237927 isoform X1 [Anguilla rostrata]|uniref:uncharacterized protein LOC135237927 isoform X1 n=1 Tax=Anguilla rostrata TaxID=7938 RepID=UPI0030D2ABFD
MLPGWLARVCFFSSVTLWHIPVSTALSYTVVPRNVSQDVGKAATFLCGVSPETAATRVDFTIYRRHGNYSVLCPGEPLSLPSQGLNGYCEVKGEELRAVWSVAYNSRKDNGTYVACRPTGLSPAFAYLTVKGNGAPRRDLPVFCDPSKPELSRDVTGAGSVTAVCFLSDPCAQRTAATSPPSSAASSAASWGSSPSSVWCTWE